MMIVKESILYVFWLVACVVLGTLIALTKTIDFAGAMILKVINRF